MSDTETVDSSVDPFDDAATVDDPSAVKPTLPADSDKSRVLPEETPNEGEPEEQPASKVE